MEMPKTVQNKKCLIKPTQSMLKRIGKLQRPVLKNDEEYQRVQIIGISQLLKEMMSSTIQAINQIGGLDQSAYEYNEEVGADVVSQEFFNAVERATNEKATELMRLICAGMQSSAVNYAGLVLTGKMNPIYDASLDDEEMRKSTRESAERLIAEAGLGLIQQGALEETENGKMILREKYRLFDTIKGSNYGKGSVKQKAEPSIKCVKQPAKHQATDDIQ